MKPLHLLLLALIVLSIPRAQAQTLLARYGFDEGLGTTIYDSSGNHLDLTMSGGTSFLSPGVGDTGYALHTNATVASNAAKARNTDTGTTFDGLTSYTITLWVNTASAMSGRLLSLGTDNTNKLEFYSAGSGRMYITAANPTTGSSAAVTSGTSTLYGTTGEWIFMAVTVDTTVSGGSYWNGGVKFYAGSETVTSASVGSNYGTTGSFSGMVTGDITNLTLANSFSGTSSASYRALLDASLDDVRIYSGALSASQIEAIRLSAVPEPNTYGFVLLGVALMGWTCRRRMARNE